MKVLLLIVVTLSLFLAISLAQNKSYSGGRKLVCEQVDGSSEALKGFCSRRRSTGKCYCTTDCDQHLSQNDCVCTSVDLAYARDQKLANCSVWTEKKWKHYVSRERKELAQNISFATPSNTEDGKGLLFTTDDDGLPWPLTDPYNNGIMLIHGPHCLHMIEMFNQQLSEGKQLDNVADYSHYEHCRRLARRVLAFYQKEKEYSVKPSSICTDIGSVAQPHLSSSRNADDGISYGIDYNRALKKDNHDDQITYTVDYDRAMKKNNAAQSVGGNADDGISYGIDYDRAMKKNHATRSVSGNADDGISYGIDYDRAMKKNHAARSLNGNGDDGISYGIDYDRAMKKDNPDDGISYGIDYDRAVKKNNAAQSVGGNADDGISYGIDYDRAMKKNHAARSLNGNGDDGISYGIDYDRAMKKDNPDDGISYGIDYDRAVKKNYAARSISGNAAESRDVFAQVYRRAQQKLNSTSVPLTKLYNIISGQNLGNLLLRDWLEEPMTAREREYLSVWESDRVVRIAAFSIYCNQGQGKHVPTKYIQKLLKMIRETEDDI
ncbi:hypothetical protein I4U23_005774 [Adineta vaga]|nr:hypothetical protein I4U23_005774 [Adineta vaga]